MEECIEDHNILPEHRFAFRKELGLKLQALRVVEKIKVVLQRKEVTGVILLDVEKTFDRVWREVLIHNMIDLQSPPLLILLTDFFFQDRTFQIR